MFSDTAGILSVAEPNIWGTTEERELACSTNKLPKQKKEGDIYKRNLSTQWVRIQITKL